MKIKYNYPNGKYKYITLFKKDKKGDHWYIDEDPFIIHDYEIINGEFRTEQHDKFIESYNKFINIDFEGQFKNNFYDQFLDKLQNLYNKSTILFYLFVVFLFIVFGSVLTIFIIFILRWLNTLI